MHKNQTGSESLAAGTAVVLEQVRLMPPFACCGEDDDDDEEKDLQRVADEARSNKTSALHTAWPSISITTSSTLPCIITENH